MDSHRLTTPPAGQNEALKNALQQHTTVINLDEEETNNTQQRTIQQRVEEKPPVGSPEWHKMRRENHKQVERRRRQTINESIDELAKIVPGCEKNKGSILQRAALYIRQLKEAEAATVEKWTLEKLLTDQAISELNRQVEVLKADSEKLQLENDYLKRKLDQQEAQEDEGHEQILKRQKIEFEEEKLVYSDDEE